MKPVSHADLVALLRPHDPPCVSLLVPVDGREGSDAAAVRLANGVRALRGQLDAWASAAPGRAAAAAEAATATESIVEELAERPWDTPTSAWSAPTRGLAVFVAPGWSSVHRLPVALPELAACDDAFRVRPLLEHHASNMEFHLLTLHRDEVRLCAGSAERLDDLPLGDIPHDLEKAIGAEWDDSQQGRSFHGSPASSKQRGEPAATGLHSHGYGGSDREDERDVQRFLSRVGHALPRGMGDPASPPLVVMAVDKTLGMFKKLHPNIRVADGGVPVDPKGRDAQDLHARAWAALEAERRARIARTLEAVEAGLPRGRSSKDLETIAKAAVAGRVDTLVLALGRHDCGEMDGSTGALRLDGPHGRGRDVLEQLAATVMLHRGDVHFADHGALHAHAGATFRY